MTHDNTSPAHTTRDWRVWITPGDTLYINDGDRSIAALVHTGITPEENAANAHLIAAAPKMLQRLKMAVKDAKDALSGEWIPTNEGWQSIIQDVQDTIDEAEGNERR